MHDISQYRLSAENCAACFADSREEQTYSGTTMLLYSRASCRLNKFYANVELAFIIGSSGSLLLARLNYPAFALVCITYSANISNLQLAFRGLCFASVVKHKATIR